jgi:hypothetical protein
VKRPSTTRPRSGSNQSRVEGSTSSGRPEPVEGRISYLAWDQDKRFLDFFPYCASRFTNDASRARSGSAITAEVFMNNAG